MASLKQIQDKDAWQSVQDKLAGEGVKQGRERGTKRSKCDTSGKVWLSA